MISRCSAERPVRHFRSITLLSFFSRTVPGSSDGSSIAPAASSSNSSSGRRLSAERALKRAMANIHVDTAERPSNRPAWRHTSRNTSLIRSSAVASSRTRRTTNRNTRTWCRAYSTCIANRSPFAIRPISTSSDVACIATERPSREVSRRWEQLGSRFRHRDDRGRTPPSWRAPVLRMAFGGHDYGRSAAQNSASFHRYDNKFKHLYGRYRYRETPRAARPQSRRYARPARHLAAGLVREWLAQVPTRSGALSLRSAARTESAVIRPVLGFSDGIFSIDRVNRAESLSTSMVWQLRSTAGSAQISTVVRSGPIPASDRAAATLTLAGNPAAASRAVPANTRLAVLRPSTEMRFASR